MKLDLAEVLVKTGTIYPDPYAALVAGRSHLRLGAAGGLTQFGVNITILQPGAMSSLRHWHLHEDEFVMMLEGECVLVQDAGEVTMRAADCAAFPAGDSDGHHLMNRSDREARFLVVGTRAAAETVTYCDVDMMVHQGGGTNRFTYKDGTEWQGPR